MRWLAPLLLLFAACTTPRAEGFDVWLEGSRSWGTYREGPGNTAKHSPPGAGHDRTWGVSGGVTFHFSLEEVEVSDE